MSRVLLLIVLILATAGAAWAYGDPVQISRAGSLVSEILRKQMPPQLRAVEIARGNTGEFGLQATINGVNAPMVIDTGATSVVLTYETA